VIKEQFMSVSDFFANPTAWGIILAFLFGLVWLAFLAPRQLNRLPPWLIFIIGAAVFAPCIAWIQIPLQSGVSNLLISCFGQDSITDHILLASIPGILLSGIVQEGAKMIPTVIYWVANRRRIYPVLGLTMGAMAGAGFGILEAQWIHNLILSYGWTTQSALSTGFLGFTGFWERFFTISFHISLGALTGYGLARGWGWQFYLLAAGIHAMMNYNVILLQIGILTNIGIELLIAFISIVLFLLIAWLRWKKYEEWF
jgi:RsiW-degrading membrane proteinase PrsW (M82 family)